MDKIIGSGQASTQAHYQKTKHHYNNSASSQRARILAWLKKHRKLSTMTARNVLGVQSPASRIRELRQAGYNIMTNWLIEADANSAPHRMGEYILIGESKEAANGAN